MKEQTPASNGTGRKDALFSADSRRFSAPAFRFAWYSINVLLVTAVILVAWSAAWEYSTQRYLKGFSDAVIPESASDETKIQAILDWFAFGPARRDGDDPSLLPDRDPTETLNYAKLLRTCGTATNAFVNLADAAGMRARRLLLLDSNRLTRHVVAEVLIDGRWIVVDPAFHRILRGTDGHSLTRQELAQPAVWSAAIANVPGYDPTYTYDLTAHVRLSRLAWLGRPLRMALDRLAPDWEDSGTLTLLLERKSLAGLVASVFLLLLVYVSRRLLRRYGESRLQIRTMRFTDQVKRAIFLSFSRAPESEWDGLGRRASRSQVPAGTADCSGAAPGTGAASAPTSTTI